MTGYRSEVENENNKSYILYISDYGEELYDGKNFMGHGETIINKYVAKVPMFLWLSDNYKMIQKNIEDIEKLVNRRYSSGDLLYTLMDLSNIEWEKFDKSRSIINENYKLREIKHVNKNYDEVE